MRDIKFRGRRIDGGQWVYGYYVVDPLGRSRIYCKPFPKASSNTYYMVDPETVGQFIGLKDQVESDIYEGDRCMTDAGNIVSFEYKNGMFVVVHNEHWYESAAKMAYWCKVIGNIHE